MSTSQDVAVPPTADDDAATLWRRSGRLWLVVAVFAAVGIARSVQVDIPFKDPHGAYLRGRVALTVAIFAGWVVVEGLVRAGRPVRLGRTWAAIRERWTPQRLALAWSALLAYHATYFIYHNLKSWDVLNQPRDGMLASWDRWLWFGHSPAVVLHDLLGQHLTAWVLYVWYETFPTLVVAAFPAAVALAPRLRDAYVAIAAFVWVWILGTGTYYLIPSLGPFHEDPQDFAGLPHMPIQDTQAHYMAQRDQLLAHPHAPDSFAQVSAFASLHVGVAAVIMGVAWWYGLRRLTTVLAVFVAGTLVATVYLGWHFFVDLPAGLGIALLSWFLGPLTVGVRRRARPGARSGPGDPAADEDVSEPEPAGRQRGSRGATARFALSWAAALTLTVAVLPQVVHVSWGVVPPILESVDVRAGLALLAVWFLGLYVHSFVLTAAAPSLTQRRALTLNLTGSAVSNVVPLGGAAGVELNRRMMRTWGIDGRAFTGFTFLTNLWDVASKLLLPVVAVLALARAGESVPQIRTASFITGTAFVVVVGGAAAVLRSPRGAQAVGRGLERASRAVLRVLRRDRELGLEGALLDIREQCADLVARGWLRMSAGITGYLALQGVLLGLCLHLTGATNTWPEVLAAFAVERALTVVPLTPGGMGIADLGLVGVLLTLGGDPASVAGAAILYRAFIFALEIPVGSGALGVWLLRQRLSARRALLAGRASGRLPTSWQPGRVAHVTDVFLPRLGGIETHVDEVVRQQRARGIEAEVLTPARRDGSADPAWVRRLSVTAARRAVAEYDAVHVHVSMFSPYGIAVARAGIRAGVPVLVTVHSMWSGAGGLLRLAAVAGLRRWPVSWSAVSGAAAEVFGRSLGGVEVAVLPNAVDVAHWRQGSPPAERPGDPMTVISVMRLMPRKRPLQLVRLFELAQQLAGARELRLVIVGDGPLRARTERAVRRRGLADQVRITGRVSREAVRTELTAASVYVAPAPKESFGIAALEARAAGLPVVASRRSGVGEFVRDGVEGLLVDGDVQLATALSDLARDPVLRRRIAAHNREVAPVQDWDHVLDSTTRLYAAAAERAHAHHGALVARGQLALAES